MKPIVSFIFVCLPVLALATENLDVRIELGQTEVHSNYFRVPKSASRVAFPEGQEQFTGRLYLNYHLSEESHLRLLYAPYRVSATVAPSANIDFKNQVFAAGTPVDIDYKFNSYRLSYIRQWKTEKAFRPHVGFTGKIRDAEIKLSNFALTAKRGNVGLVPLLNFGFEYHLSPSWLTYFDLDGSAAKQGRALDGLLELRYLGFTGLQAGVGIRVLDGGVNTDSNENFAQLRTMFVSISKSF